MARLGCTAARFGEPWAPSTPRALMQPRLGALSPVLGHPIQKHIHCWFASRSAVCCYLLFLPVPGHHTKDEKPMRRMHACMHVTLPGHATVRPGQRILMHTPIAISLCRMWPHANMHAGRGSVQQSLKAK